MGPPTGVTILIVTVLIFTSLNVLRVFNILRFWEALVEPLMNTPVVYLITAGSIWTGLGIILTLGLLTRRKWSAKLAKISIVAYIIHYWVDRLLIADPSSIASRWPFAASISIALFLFTYWVLERPKTRVYLVR